MAWDEATAWNQGGLNEKFYQALLDEATEAPSRNARRKKVVRPDEMPWEMSRQGLLKHLLNARMNTRMETVDAYMQFIPPGSRSGRHRHLAEECLYVVEGRGYDLHWDVRFDCNHEMEFSWEEEPKRFDWKMGDFVYIPPYCMHKHFNADPKNEARIVVINSRIVKAMGFDWIEQIEPAEGY